MPDSKRVVAAQEALQRLSARDTQEVLGLLCSERPEAVLGAVDALHRHRAVVASLRQRAPGTTLPFDEQ